MAKNVSIPFHSGLGYYLKVHHAANLCIKSQSLFIQGWGTTHQQQLRQQQLRQVSIPFHSGLGYY